MDNEGWVKCTITYYYSRDSYIYDTDENIPTDEEILKRCKEMMVEDVSSIDDPLMIDAVYATFEKPPWNPIPWDQMMGV